MCSCTGSSEGRRWPPLKGLSKRGQWNVCLSVIDVGLGSPADVDALFERLTDAGHPGVLQPFDAPWGQRYATVTDINGDGLLDVVVSNKKGVFVFEQVRARGR